MCKKLLTTATLTLALLLGDTMCAGAITTPPASVQNYDVSNTGNITSANTPLTLPLNNKSTATIFIPTVTFSATLVVQGTFDGTHFTTLSVLPQNSSTGVSSITAAGTWTVGVAGMSQIQVVAISYSSGTIATTIRAAGGSNILNCLNGCQSQSSAYHVAIAIPLGSATGTVSTGTQYPLENVPNYANGQITTLFASGTSNDNGTTVFTISKNGTSIGTISFTNGSSTASTTLGVPVGIVQGDVLSLRCTTAGTIQNVSVTAGGLQDTQ